MGYFTEKCYNLSVIYFIILSRQSQERFKIMQLTFAWEMNLKGELSMDAFANIAEGGIGGRKELLYDPSPMEFTKRSITLEESDLTPFAVKPEISTKEELYFELDKMRRQYAPYLEELAPRLADCTRRQSIREFVLNGKEKITVPEYGGPIGYAKKVYESDFLIDELHDDKAYFVRFLGADYKAVVYVNGACVGIHEGFFSPFEFEISKALNAGKNALKIELYNDYIFMGNGSIGGESFEGEKLYAATGLGWNDPNEGWHHCPPGMGIYNKVFIEERSTVHISDAYVRPLLDEGAAELWVEINNTEYSPASVTLSLSLYGQNFVQTVFENMIYSPTAEFKNDDGEPYIKPLAAKHGVNLYKVKMNIYGPRAWEPSSPYLYQAQVSVCVDGEVTDRRAVSFGMRSFHQDTESIPKGRFYLNGKEIKLRGANTMGFLQQDVLREDREQLIDDILLAKLCNMNFLRLTQRPVQDEIYSMSDRLGLMLQTDLPLFACMRRSSYCEGIRQAEEMERLVRRHPCNIILTYINEPFPNAYDEPHRHLTRSELEGFFACCDTVIGNLNPDRVIKHVDGDYDPPSATLPDNHCYNLWYNGHGIDFGKLHKGHWFDVKRDWCFGCGEHGIEGLDPRSVMEKYYPKSWLCEPFDPANIIRAQSAGMHGFFYDTPDSLDEWITATQAWQAEGTKLMTEAFRRNPLMVSNAIHLFIDAWPAGWMKTVMDCERTPKPAYFAYRKALSPILLSLRTDRYTYYAGELISIETYACNDTSIESDLLSVRYELYRGDELVKAANAPAHVSEQGVDYMANCEFTVERVDDREVFKLRAILLDEQGLELNRNEIDIEVFEDVIIPENPKVVFIEKLDEGEHTVAGERVTVEKCVFGDRHFVSRKTGHPAVSGFKPNDFRHWYSSTEDMITPIANTCFFAEGFEPILTTVNKEADGGGKLTSTRRMTANIAAVKKQGDKYYVICQADLRMENPIAKRFKKAVLDYCR